MKYLLAAFLSVIAVQSGNAGEHWNQFRGPRGNGVSTASALPIEFDEAKNVRWKVAIPDSGWSSPVVWENEIWLTAGSDEKEELRAICVDLESGKITKNIKVFDMIERKVDPANKWDSPHLNSPATPTPVVENGRVFVSFGSQGIACLDRKTGQKVWERRDLRVYQPVRQGSSPIVDDKHLYVAFDGTDQQFFVALDKTTGETRWRTDRNVSTDWEATLRSQGISPKKVSDKPNDNKKSFATATLIDVGGQRQLIAPAAEATIAYDPATGKELWRVLHPGGFNVAARPVYANGLVYVFTSGVTRLLMGIRPDGSGNVTDTHIAWSTTRSTPNIPSPILVDDLLFMVTDKGGIARCLNAKTGDAIWKKRLGGDHWASPLFADGKLYFSSKQGDVTVLEASRSEPEILARNRMNASFIASPAVAGSSLILRSTTHLYCVSNGYQRSEEEVARDKKQQPPAIASKTQQDIDWDAAYEKLLKSNSALLKKVESGGAAKEQVIGWLKQKSGAKSSKGKSDSKAQRRNKVEAKPGKDELEEYFAAIRAAEAELMEAEAWLDRPKPHVDEEPPKDITDSADLIGRARALLNLIPLILQTDSSRIITMVIQDHLAVPKISGVTAEHHNLSHHGQDPEKIKQLKIIETEILKSFGDFLSRMSRASEADGRLLDQTSVLFGSNLGNANAHDPRNLPILLAGGGYQHGRYVAYDAANNTPLCNLFVSLLNRMNIQTDSFATSTGELTW